MPTWTVTTSEPVANPDLWCSRPTPPRRRRDQPSRVPPRSIVSHATVRGSVERRASAARWSLGVASQPNDPSAPEARDLSTQRHAQKWRRCACPGSCAMPSGSAARAGRRRGRTPRAIHSFAPLARRHPPPRSDVRRQPAVPEQIHAASRAFRTYCRPRSLSTGRSARSTRASNSVDLVATSSASPRAPVHALEVCRRSSTASPSGSCRWRLYGWGPGAPCLLL